MLQCVLIVSHTSHATKTLVKLFSDSSFSGNVRLSLHEPNKGLDELNKRLLTFVDHLRARRGGLGLGGRKDAASWG